MKRSLWIGIALLALALVAALSVSVSRLRAEVRSLQTQLQTPQTTTASSKTSPATPAFSLGALPDRVTQLERAVAELSTTADHLVARGNVPPSPTQIERLQLSFLDANASERDRLRALRLLRRNGGLNDEIANQAMALLQTSTNANTRRDLLRELDGSITPAMKDPLMLQLATEGSGEVREELIDVLGNFNNDPAVEKKIWDLALNDPDDDVREQAADALAQGKVSPERLQSLKDKAINPQATFDERLLALNTLQQENATSPEVVAEMINLAQNLNDPVAKARLFGALEGVRDPNLMPTLVTGLSDANPVVRENAVEALRPFANDPRIKEWLTFVSQNDTDSRVKREAHQILARQQQRR